MFNEVSIATERLALCLRLQRRIGAAHAMLHLRRVAAACLRENVRSGQHDEDEMCRVAAALARPLKELDDALAADRLDPRGIADAEARLSYIRFQLWRLECFHDRKASIAHSKAEIP